MFKDGFDGETCEYKTCDNEEIKSKCGEGTICVIKEDKDDECRCGLNCENDQQCQEVTTDGVVTGVCKCDENWQGENCEYMTCENPEVACVPDEECNEVSTGYECVPLCTPPCLNGHCDIKDDRSYCDCKVEWGGEVIYFLALFENITYKV